MSAGADSSSACDPRGRQPSRDQNQRNPSRVKSLASSARTRSSGEPKWAPMKWSCCTAESSVSQRRGRRYPSASRRGRFRVHGDRAAVDEMRAVCGIEPGERQVVRSASPIAAIASHAGSGVDRVAVRRAMADSAAGAPLRLQQRDLPAEPRRCKVADSPASPAPITTTWSVRPLTVRINRPAWWL